MQQCNIISAHSKKHWRKKELTESDNKPNSRKKLTFNKIL